MRLQPLSPTAVERILTQDPAATARVDAAAELTRVVAHLEALLVAGEVASDRVAAFRRAVGHAWLGVASMDESRDGCDPRGS